MQLVGRQHVRIVTFLMTLGVMTMVPACAGRAAPVPQPTDGGQPTVSILASTPSRPDHVVVVILENKDAQDVVREGPYLALAGESGVSLTDMHAETHPSQPNYLALFSGDTQGVTDDACPLTFAAPSLAGELAAAGDSFVGYAEDLPPRASPDAGPGATRASTARGRTSATFRPRRTSRFRTCPRISRDCRPSPSSSRISATTCTTVPSRWATAGSPRTSTRYARWARTHNSLLIVTFDESEADGDRDNHIATVAVGERVMPGPVTERTDHYRLLRTIEDLYGLRPLGHSAEAAKIGSLWQTGT